MVKFVQVKFEYDNLFMVFMIIDELFSRKCCSSLV